MSLEERTNRSIVPIEGVTGNWLSQYQEEADQSLAALQEYRVVPRIKVIQAMTAQALKDAFGEGSAVVLPGGQKLAGKKESFAFVPQFFYTEFIFWRHLDDKGGNAILARSFDPNSEIAVNARDPNKREAAYEGAPTGKKGRYSEHLNFVGVIYGGELAGTTTSLSFSRGEFGTGKSFISSALMRKEVVNGERMKVPLWAQVWRFQVNFRDRGAKKWYGIDPLPSQPGEQQIIKDEEMESFREASLDYKSLHEAQRLMVDHGDQNEDEATATDNVNVDPASSRM